MIFNNEFSSELERLANQLSECPLDDDCWNIIVTSSLAEEIEIALRKAANALDE